MIHRTTALTFTGIDRLLLGSDAEQVARIAPVPVMLVRTDGSEG